MWFLEYGKGNYWAGGKMVEHAIRIALLIFRIEEVSKTRPDVAWLPKHDQSRNPR